jgi:hypothetical protein
VERYYRLEREIFEKTFVEDVKYLPPSLMLDRLIDPLLELHCAWPAYAHILLGTDVSVDIAAAACGSETDINEKLAEFFCLISPNLDHEQVLMAAVICKTSLKGLISLVVGSNDEKYRNQVILEYKKMMLAYLQPIFWPGINNPPS